MTVILTTSPGFGRAGPVADAIAAEGWELVRCTEGPDMAEKDHLGRADYLVAGLPPVTEGTLRQGRSLKGVLKHGVGIDNIDIAACSAAGVPVSNTPGANADAVAELAIGLIFALARNIVAGHDVVTSGRWERRQGRQVGGKVLGIVGFGNIGRRLAKLGSGLGMQVIAADPFAEAARLQVGILPLEALLARADFVSLHVFGGAENAALIDAGMLARMKPGACLLNLARGEVVDLDAVAAALESGHLGGVAIDAYTVEPPDIAHPVFAHPRAIFTPHSGADTQEAMENTGMMVVEDIRTLLAGRMPSRCLNAGEL